MVHLTHRPFLVSAVVAALAGVAAARPDFTYVGAAVAIPDGTGVGTPGAAASALISIPSALTITVVTCSVYIPHSFQGDLRVTLTHIESGRTAVLIDRPYVPQTALGFPAPNYGTTVDMLLFADTGQSIYDAPAVAPPGITGVSGLWRPQTVLGTFVGQNAQGTWRLSAVDYAAGDTGSIVGFKVSIAAAATCWVNCDASTAGPFLNANDFLCFLSRYASADPYANCDASVAAPVLNIMDFLCFLNRFAAGCSAP